MQENNDVRVKLANLDLGDRERERERERDLQTIAPGTVAG